MAFKEKRCKECGSVFTPKNGFQVYCAGPHYTVCEICGASIEYTCSPKDKPRYCSSACRNIGKRNTVRSRYGVDNVSELDWVRDKIGKRNSSKEVVSHRTQTCMERYGVDNVAKQEQVRERLRQSSRSDQFRTKLIETSLEKYGCPYPMQSAQVKERKMQSTLARYGGLSKPLGVNTYSKINADGTKAAEFLEFKQDPKRYITSHFAEIPTVAQLETCLGVADTPIYDVLVAHDCSNMIRHVRSRMEREVSELLDNICPGISMTYNDRTVIKPLEIDIWLPEYQLGIECDPTSTHNSSTGAWNDAPKHYKYHQAKSLAAQEKGVFIFHIFGYEWANRRDVIESMLCNLLRQNSTTIGARNTYVCTVSHKEAKDFLNSNHRQGYAVSSVLLGLRTLDDNCLVSVMTFSRPRSSLGKTKDNNMSWELTRFCSKRGYSIPGGASKLLKAFRQQHSGGIFSFSDIAHTKGTLYEKLGFQKVSITPPSYVWTKLNNSTYLSRVACQKRNLSKLFNEEIDLTKTEKQIMEEHGFVRVYDCGVCRWELT